MRKLVSNRGLLAKSAVSTGVVCLATGLVASGPSSAAPVYKSLTGECGADNVTTSYTSSVGINSDMLLSVSRSETITFGANRRKARFRFFGTKASTYHWTSYQYRYAIVRGYDYGPQSNEVVRFGRDRDSWGDGYWWEYSSPDNHNSNLDGTPAPQQSLPSGMTTPLSGGDIWVKAIFDVPNNPDPYCYTHAVQVTK